MSSSNYVTEEGLIKLKEDLEHMMKVERPSISKQIAEARDKGDLSENAEYDAAKEAQGLLEMRIIKLQETVRKARVIDISKIDNSKVQILNKVKIKNLKFNKDFYYTIVAPTETNVKENRISIDSPIAKGLLGKKVGDVVEIKVPSGVMTFEIMEISI